MKQPSHYQDLLRENLERDRQTFTFDVTTLADFLHGFLDMGRGLRVAREAPSMSNEDILSAVCNEDLFYLSLIDHLPKGVSLATHDFSVQKKGLHFYHSTPCATAAYTLPFSQFLSQQNRATYVTFEDLLDEGRSIYLFLKNQRKSGNNTEPNGIEEITSSENSGLTLGDLSRYIIFPDGFQVDGSYAVLFSLDAPVILHPDGSIDFFEYSPEYNRAIHRHWATAKRYFQRTKTEGDNEHIRKFMGVVRVTLGSVVDELTRSLPGDNLLPVDSYRLSLEEKYHIRIPINFTHSGGELYPGFTLRDLNVVASLLEILRPTIGKFIDEVHMIPPDKGFDGTLESACEMVIQREGRAYDGLSFGITNHQELAEDLTLRSKSNPEIKYHREEDMEVCLVLSECDIMALEYDQTKFLTPIIRRVAGEAFSRLPQKDQAEYQRIVRGQQRSFLEFSQTLGLAPPNLPYASVVLDFRRSSAEYIVAQTENRDPRISPECKVYFDKLFSRTE